MEHVEVFALTCGELTSGVWRRSTQQYHPLAFTDVDCTSHRLGFEVVEIWQVKYKRDATFKMQDLIMEGCRKVCFINSILSRASLKMILVNIPGETHLPKLPPLIHRGMCLMLLFEHWDFNRASLIAVGHLLTISKIFQRHLESWWNSWTWLGDVHPTVHHNISA